MQWWFKWFIIGSLAIWLGYYRLRTSQLVRSRTAGFSLISSSLANNTDSTEFFDRSQKKNQQYFELKSATYAQGVCGNLQVPPMQRPCTPPLHVHLNQTEIFTIIQGQLGYKLGDKIYSCNIHTCPQPLTVPPLVPHTFWMDDNKEDLILIVRVEPAYKDHGIRREFFENFSGILRDEYVSIWQLAVIFENAETYPVLPLPLSLTKIIVRTTALIGKVLGYKIKYEEYTTVAD